MLVLCFLNPKVFEYLISYCILSIITLSCVSLKESAVLAELQHPNVVCLLGVVTQEHPVCMLFEFLPQGDLHEFLIMRSPHSDVGCSSDEDGTVKSSLDHGDFLHIAIQVHMTLFFVKSESLVHTGQGAPYIFICSLNIMDIKNYPHLGKAFNHFLPPSFFHKCAFNSP